MEWDFCRYDLSQILIDKNYYVSEQEVNVSEQQQEAKDHALTVSTMLFNSGI